ncbi:BTAD domain-containing putative transcriptional regulator, partial [Actinoplanes sp. NPDC051633]|uniref:AfsR/SARP family transcriptional regulator n=1 Tax=Actinoplanes sp. NPDC051633 TaxID=3155670 RepID=UPI00341D71A3
MEIGLLGPLVVTGARGPVALGSARQRAVLVTLALHAGAPVPVGRLIDAVWPEDPPESVRNSLQSHVARLRSVLGDPGVIVLDPAGYRLALPPDCVDALRFERLIRAGDVDAALALWRGAPLPEFATEPFLGWAARLTDAHRAGLVRRAEAQLGEGRAEEAVAGLRAAVESDARWEPGALMMARALAAADRRGDAAAALRRHADAVVDALGMDPSPAVKRLQVALLRGEPLETAPEGSAAGSGTTPADGPAQAQRPGPPTRVAVVPRDSTVRVPLRFSSFVGRDAEQARLAQLLAEPGLVCVVGPGGVGKTRLVAETVRAGALVAWVDAADVRGRDDFLQAVAVGVGARLGPLDEPLAAIATAAGAAKPLIVLDNCEHLLDPAAEVVEALLPCAVRIVVTSQERLRVDGERVLVLGPLSADAGARLFADRAHHAVDDAGAVADIVAGLDALPLAIELAATQATALGVAQLRDRLGDRLDLLTRGRRTGAARHRTLRAVVEWSFGLLEPLESRVLCRLASFAGGFTIALAEAVVADEEVPRTRVAGVLAALVDRSLVVRHGPRRYRLLETVRAYAGERLAGSPDATATYRRHAAAIVAAAEEQEARMHGPEQIAGVRELDALLPDLRRARLSGDPDVLVRLAAATYRYGYHCQHYEVLAWGYDAVPVTGRPRLALALAAAATHAWGRGDLAAAQSLASRAADEGGETYGAHEVLGDVALVNCDPAAVGHYRAMAVAGPLSVQASGMVGEALVMAYSGQFDQAVELASSALDRAVAAENPSALAEAHYGMGEALGDVDPPRALEHLATAARLAASVDDRLFTAASETAAAAIAGRHGDPAAALASFREVLALWRRAGNDTLQINALRNLLVLLA